MLTGYPPAEMGEGNLLDDEVFRLMIKARIIQNAWKAQLVSCTIYGTLSWALIKNCPSRICRI